MKKIINPRSSLFSSTLFRLHVHSFFPKSYLFLQTSKQTLGYVREFKRRGFWQEKKTKRKEWKTLGERILRGLFFFHDIFFLIWRIQKMYSRKNLPNPMHIVIILSRVKICYHNFFFIIIYRNTLNIFKIIYLFFLTLIPKQNLKSGGQWSKLGIDGVKLSTTDKHIDFHYSYLRGSS